MNDEFGRFDLKECADALSEVIAKAKEKAKLPKFSELSSDWPKRAIMATITALPARRVSR